MKATLQFDLNEKVDLINFLLASRARDWCYVITDFENYLRKKIKNEPLNDDERELIDEIRSRLWDIIRGYDLEAGILDWSS
jgi:hypothetical protein